MSFIILILIYVFVNKVFIIKFSGKKEWSEGQQVNIGVSMFDDEKINNNDPDLLTVPQYGRYPDYTG